jgi:hypothetical protein
MPADGCGCPWLLITVPCPCASTSKARYAVPPCTLPCPCQFALASLCRVACWRFLPYPNMMSGCQPPKRGTPRPCICFALTLSPETAGSNSPHSVASTTAVLATAVHPTVQNFHIRSTRSYRLVWWPGYVQRQFRVTALGSCFSEQANQALCRFALLNGPRCCMV